jgi:hypothetical protein
VRVCLSVGVTENVCKSVDSCFAFKLNRKDLGSFLKMAHGCRNMHKPAY